MELSCSKGSAPATMSAVPAPKRHAAPAPSRRWSLRLHPGFALGALIEVSALVAILLHRNGHTQGDDFALYSRQARSVFDGDIGQVLADNRFTVTNSASGFSPFTPGHVNHWNRWGFSTFIGTRFIVTDVASPLPWTMVRATR